MTILDPLTRKDHNARFRLKNKLLAINHYGGKCACCGETNVAFLSIDHINGGGSKHFSDMKSRDLSQWLKNNNYPDGFQVLCFNCNWAKYIYGVCPHQQPIPAPSLFHGKLVYENV